LAQELRTIVTKICNDGKWTTLNVASNKIIILSKGFV